LTLTANLMLAEHVANGLPSHHVYIVSLVRAQGPIVFLRIIIIIRAKALKE